MSIHLFDSYRGGWSEESSRGYAKAFKSGANLDIRKYADTLSCNQAMTKESGSVVVDLPIARVNCSDGNTYWFGDTGKIYKRTSAGVWSLEATDGTGKITGAFEWNSKIYWATDVALKSTAVSAINWGAPTAVGALTTGFDHTIIAASGELFICDGQRLCAVSSAHAFTATRFEVTPDCITTTIDEKDGYITVGCKKKDDLSEGYIFLFDPQNTLNTNFYKRFRIPADGVNSMITNEGVFAQVGNGIYYADFVNVLPIQKIDNATTRPYSIVTSDALVLFGMKGCTYPGIYTYGRKRKNMPAVLNLEYTLSPDATTIISTTYTSAVTDIGAITMAGDTLLVSWKTATGYGVDAISTTTKANAFYESLEFFIPPVFTRPYNVPGARVTMKPLPTGTSVALKYKMDKSDTWVTAVTASGATSFTTANEKEIFFNINQRAFICYEIRLELTASANTTPEIYRIEVNLP